MDARIAKLEATIRARRDGDAAHSYVASIFAKGRKKIAEKVGEEATETIIAALCETPEKLTSEAADLLFHLAILLIESDLSLDDVLNELERREGVSGIAEKASRYVTNKE
jgi:phosphoribosyl-ATP pyrophosphohydrolase